MNSSTWQMNKLACKNRLTYFNFSTRSCLALSSISCLYCSTSLCSIIFISIWLLRFTTSCSNFFLFFYSFSHFFCIPFIDNNSSRRTWFFASRCRHFEDAVSSSAVRSSICKNEQYCLVMRQVDWAQPNSNPGSNRYDGICIVECRTRDYSENQERSSNHQESQNIFFTVIIFVTQHLHLILHSFLFFLHKMTTSHLLVECLLLPPLFLMPHVLKKFEGYCIELSRAELINASQKKIVKIRLSLINLTKIWIIIP